MPFWRMLKEVQTTSSKYTPGAEVSTSARSATFSMRKSAERDAVSGIKVGTSWGGLQPLQQAQSPQVHRGRQVPGYEGGRLMSELKAKQARG